MSLKQKTQGYPETISADGVVTAGVPVEYQRTDEDLSLVRDLYMARIEAIERELHRRQFETEEIVLTFLADRFQDRTEMRRSYSDIPTLN